MNANRSRTRHVTCWLAVCAAIVGVVISLDAQQAQPRKYERFDFDPDVAKMLKERLQAEANSAGWENVIKKIAQDPKFKVDPKDIEEWKKDPEKLKRFMDNNPGLKDYLKSLADQKLQDKPPPDMKKVQDDLKKFLADLKVNDDPKSKPKDNGTSKDKPGPNDPKVPINPNKQGKIEPPPKAKAEPVAKAAERAMKEAEKTKLGDWLRDSPAWKRAFDDLQGATNRPDGGTKKSGDWTDKLRIPEGKLWNLGEGMVDRMKNLPRPNFERVGPQLPGIGNVPQPNVAVPAMPDVSSPSMPTFSTAFLWLLLVVLFLLIAWQVLRWNKRARSSTSDDPAAQLGPWPVQPGAVATRAELVQAFDYLALLTLGVGAQCWNHQAVARRWHETAPQCAVSAERLAQLYEQARYTEGADELTLPERDQARQSLLQLAEVL